VSRGLEELRAAVLANPDADEPRLVYADALVERGDPQGELIQVQIALARDPDQPELMKREDALLRHFENPSGYRRGFVHEVAMRDRIDREIFAREPLTTLAYVGPDAELETAAQGGLLARIEELTLRTSDATIGIAERLPRLRRHSIIDGEAPLVVPVLRALPRLAGFGLPSLRRYGAPIGPFEDVLAAAPPLEWLDIRHRPAYRYMDALLGWQHLDELVELRWDGTRAERFGHAGVSLRRLELDEGQAALLAALADGPIATRLERIVIASAAQRTNDEVAFLRPGSFPRLRELALGGECVLRRDAIAALFAAAPRLGRLRVRPADDGARVLLAEQFPEHRS
jgi:uncharacterized protein (TIGR02996 family)